MASQQGPLERETVYALLADAVREFLLASLAATGRVTLSELVSKLATEQHDSNAVVGSITHESATVQLLHNHIPRLCHYDVVEYDHSSEVLTPGPAFESVEPYVTDQDSPVNSS